MDATARPRLLFVDDEASNRADVLSRCAGIGALSPEDLEALLPVACGEVRRVQ